MSKRRVVITGLGWVTSFGLDVEEGFQKLVNGTSGIMDITRFDTTEYATKIGGEVRDWDGGPNIDPRVSKRLDRFAQFAVNASADAVKDAGIDFDKENVWRCGLAVHGPEADV